MFLCSKYPSARAGSCSVSANAIFALDLIRCSRYSHHLALGKQGIETLFHGIGKVYTEVVFRSIDLQSIPFLHRLDRLPVLAV